MNILSKHKYLLIGFGKMGERYLNLLNSNNIKDIIILEKKKERIKLLISKYNINPSKIFTNLENKYFKNNLSKLICIIATTADNRFNIIKKLSDANIKNIFCEKPMARSIKEAEDIIKLCKKKKINFSINHPRRYSYENRKISEIVKKNNMGKLISLNLSGANIGIAMVAIHIIETFLFMTKSKIKNIYGKLKKNKMINPRGKKFKDYNGYIVGENYNKQKIIINSSEFAGHGYFIIYTYQRGIILQDLISGKIFANIRKKKYLNEPTYKYGLPHKNIDIYFKNSTLPDITEIALKKFLMNKNFVKPENSLEALKVVIGAIQSSNLNKIIKAKDINRKLKYEFA